MNTNIRTVFFNGHITSISPLTVALPDTANKGKMPKDTKGRPYVPAGTIRGMLRHSGAFALNVLLSSQGKNLDVDTVYMLSNGTDTARAIASSGKDAHVGANKVFREQNPFLSLFGRWGLAGKANIGNAFADSPNDVVELGGGMRLHPYDTNKDLADFIPVDQLDYVNEILVADSLSSRSVGELEAEKKAIQKQLRVAEKEEKAELNKLIDDIDVKIRETKDARTGASETIQRPLDKFEAIDANIQLSHKMVLHSPTDQELALFLWVIAMSSYDPFLGGHKHIGCGQFAAKWEVSEFKFGELTPRVIGEVAFDSENGFSTTLPIDVSAISEQILSGELDLTQYAG